MFYGDMMFSPKLNMAWGVAGQRCYSPASRIDARDARYFQPSLAMSSTYVATCSMSSSLSRETGGMLPWYLGLSVKEGSESVT